MASTIAYNLMSDDTHYTFNVVCTFDPRKAKVSYLKAENAIRVRAPPIDARIYVPRNCDTSDKTKMQLEQSESTLAISWPKVTPTAYRIGEGAREVPPGA